MRHRPHVGRIDSVLHYQVDELDADGSVFSQLVSDTGSCSREKSTRDISSKARRTFAREWSGREVAQHLPGVRGSPLFMKPASHCEGGIGSSM